VRRTIDHMYFCVFVTFTNNSKYVSDFCICGVASVKGESHYFSKKKLTLPGRYILLRCVCELDNFLDCISSGLS